MFEAVKNVCLEKSSTEDVSLKKLNDFVNVYQFYPIWKRGDKNSSVEH